MYSVKETLAELIKFNKNKRILRFRIEYNKRAKQIQRQYFKVS